MFILNFYMFSVGFFGHVLNFSFAMEIQSVSLKKECGE